MTKIRHIIDQFIHFFPVQLFILSLKKHQILLFFWILFFMTITGHAFSTYGINYLFLDPEYLNHGGYVSFAFLGVAFGGFIVTWNLTLYKLNSFRFPFLASLRWPLLTFSINNSFLPVIFASVYLGYMIQFQHEYEFVTNKNLLFDVLGFLAGVSAMVFLNAAYFQIANKDLVAMAKKSKRAFKLLRRSYYRKHDERFEDLRTTELTFRVDYYFSNQLRVKRTRLVDHYDPELLDEVFKQHHWNAILVQFLSIATLLVLGIYIEEPVFQIPAAASIFFAFSVFTSVYGLFNFWTGKWSSSAFIVLFLALNLLSKYNYLTYESRALGLDYNKAPREYSLESINALASDSNMLADEKSTLAILEKWKTKNRDNRNASKKPKLVLICASGGGLRASMFTTAILQRADSMLNGKLMPHTVMMTGASGGMLGIAYYRELYLRKLQGDSVSLYDRQYPFIVSKDLVNAINASIATNDIFYPWRALKMRDNIYRKDRGYMFEQQFIKNTGNILNKNLADYVKPEREAQIPMMLNYPVITNDARFLLIASQPMRYMMKTHEKEKALSAASVDAIDYLTFFKDYHPYDLRILTALRMNATYPWILPNVTFPTKPQFNVMDAGVRDNFGVYMFYRFVHVFDDWIEKNTSGVVIVEIRAQEKMVKIEPIDRSSFLSKIFSPFGTLTNNISAMHDYQNDNLMAALHEKMQGKLEIIRFEYMPEKSAATASMSFRLTTKEKNEIMRSVDRPNNSRAFNQLQKAL